MIFLQLFYTFFKIGLFGFGGGYAMLSMIQGEVVTRYEWLSTSEFTDIIAISQMTPGPIGINSATYVGYSAVVNAGYSHAIGVLGSVLATCAVVLPSFILMITISKFFLKYQKHPIIASVFSGLRPGVVGLLAAAALVLMNGENFGTDTRQIIISCILFAGAFLASYRYKVNPILLIVICGAAGYFIFNQFKPFITMKYTIFPLYLILCILLSACGTRKQSSSPESEGDTLTLKYAKNLCIVKYNDYTLATLRNPWDTTKVLRTYILTDKSKPQPSPLPQGTLVQVPLSRSLVYSSVHCSLLDELKAVNQIKGVCDLSYISIASIQKGCRSGKITDAGNSMSPDIEKIIDMHPDAILLSPYENSNGYGRIEKLNIPIIECADYMETSPLGRAEWMRFFGLLYGCEHKTDSLFAQVEKEYSDIKSKTSSLSEHPSVFSELKIGSTWYVAGGNSTTSQFFADAGARYIFSQLPQSGSVALSSEAVLDKAQDADFWLIKYNQEKDKTYTDLKKEDAIYAQFKAFKERQTYGCNTHYIRFYEESPFHPEYLLKDFVKIFHPELLPDYQSRYFHSLNE